MTETILAMVKSRVEEEEERVTQQKILVQKLEQEGSDILVVNERLLLAAMERTLALMRDHLGIKRKQRSKLIA